MEVLHKAVQGALDEEEWKDIRGYEGVYQASTHGRIRNTTYENVLKPTLTSTGYEYVSLAQKTGKAKKLRVHTLVLAAFVGPRPEGLVANHKDRVKTNNRPENLEWVTQSENVQHAWDLMGPSPLRGKCRVKPRECAYCGVVFTPKKSRVRHCSPSCGASGRWVKEEANGYASQSH